ncbi:MAG: phosphotransacetylase family protein [Snowella sp.]|nr:phosphotransacetylase family protein [Snowella sp.]
MANSAKILLIGSIEPYSGKSGTILGLGRQLQERGFAIAYGKPIGTATNDDQPNGQDADVQFITAALGLKDHQICPPLFMLTKDTIEKRLQGHDQSHYGEVLTTALQKIEADVILIEGPGNLSEGGLFNLSFADLLGQIEAGIILVARYHSPLVVEGLLKAKQELGDFLLGVVINDVPPDAIAETQTLIQPFLEKQGISVFGLLPQNELLRSVSVREIAHQLKAKVLCRADRLDLMVDTLTIGAMNVNSALEYFRQGYNKAVVTGGDRTDLQLAALETSTSCLILTGHVPPQPLIISRAEDLEIPILAVNLDTLKTVEIVDQAFGTVRLQESIKVDCIQQLMADHFQFDDFLTTFGLK